MQKQLPKIGSCFFASVWCGWRSSNSCLPHKQTTLAQQDSTLQTSFSDPNTEFEENSISDVEKGRETEQKLGAIFSNLLRALRTQVTIQIKGTDLRFRADAIGYEITESGESKLKILEFKSSKTARLTPNQKEAFKLLQSHDGVVAGRKKRGLLYGEGFVIPAGTTIEIIRLDEGGNWYVSDRFG